MRELVSCSRTSDCVTALLILHYIKPRAIMPFFMIKPLHRHQRMLLCSVYPVNRWYHNWTHTLVLKVASSSNENCSGGLLTGARVFVLSARGWFHAACWNMNWSLTSVANGAKSVYINYSAVQYESSHSCHSHLWWNMIERRLLNTADTLSQDIGWPAHRANELLWLGIISESLKVNTTVNWPGLLTNSSQLSMSGRLCYLCVYEA